MASEVPGARAALERAFAHSRELGLATWDPFDVKGSRLAMWTYGSRWRMPVRKALWGADLLAPTATRRCLGLKPTPSAGGVARWLQASLAMAALRRAEGAPVHAETTEAEAALEWLARDARPGPTGAGWGLPFDWQAFVVVPAGAPIGHTTMGAINALLDARDSGLEVKPGLIEKGADFLTKGLNQTVRQSESIALSYTALDHSQVVNTNAEIAAVLDRIRRPEDADLVGRVVQFVLEAQNPDGSWFYSATDANEGRQIVDHYHTGMILSALMELALHYPDVVAPLHRGLVFHLDRHFEPDGCPRMRPHTRWPVDAYSAGESVLTLLAAKGSACLAEDVRERCAVVLHHLVTYILLEMSCPTGGFIYRRWPLATMRLDSLRWANALLCHGLAEVCLDAKAT